MEQKYRPAGVNGRLVAANGFFSFFGRYDLRMKLLRIQKEIFAKEEKELTKGEYIRLVQAAERKGNMRLSLVIQTICATGIRVSELQYITVESLKKGRAEVNCKGKRRVIFLPMDLLRKLKNYAKEKGISTGVIFCTRTGCPLNRCNIWSDMKKLCRDARVNPQKVFPHNCAIYLHVLFTVWKRILQNWWICWDTAISKPQEFILWKVDGNTKKN